MKELMIDFITSLDGHASAEGWPGLWGYWDPEYLAWLDEQPDAELLMGATTYRLMSGMAAGERPDGGSDEFRDEDQNAADSLTAATKYVVSSTLDEPLAWANTTLVRGDPVEAVRALKHDGDGQVRTIGSLSLCRTLLTAGVVDRFRVVMFPVITGVTGA